MFQQHKCVRTNSSVNQIQLFSLLQQQRNVSSVIQPPKIDKRSSFS